MVRVAVFLEVPMVVLYPTETVYGLGIDPFNETAREQLYTLKGREEHKPVSWLLAQSADIVRYAEVSEAAARLIAAFLPGPLTIVLPVLSAYRPYAVMDGAVGFRVSSDPIVQRVLVECGAPLTATSANVSGLPTLPTVPEILAQFGERAQLIDRIVDDGPRTGTPSTVVRVVKDEIVVLREGAISAEAIMEAAKTPPKRGETSSFCA